MYVKLQGVLLLNTSASDALFRYSCWGRQRHESCSLAVVRVLDHPTTQSQALLVLGQTLSGGVNLHEKNCPRQFGKAT